MGEEESLTGMWRVSWRWMCRMVLGPPDRAGVDQPSRRKSLHRPRDWKDDILGEQPEPGSFGHNVCKQKADT